MKKQLTALALAGGMAVSAQAATVTTSFSGGAAAATLPTGNTVVEDFESRAAGSSLGTNAQVFDSNVDGTAARPAFASTGNFGAVLGTPSAGSFLFTLAEARSAFSFVLGSLDTFNSVRIGFTDGTFQTLNGGAIKNDASFDSGNQTVADTNGRVFYRASAGARISSVEFGSTGNSFEFDNFAVGGAVPEPAIWGMMLVGFGGIGAAVRRRRTAIRSIYA